MEDVRGVIVFVCCVAVSACGGDWTLVYEAWSSDEGGGSQELTLRGSAVRLRSFQRGRDPRASGELTPGGLEALTAARAAVTRTIADSVEFCGLADTQNYTHHLEDDVGPFTLTYCGSSSFAPVGTEALVETITDIVRGLRRCENNAVVVIDHPCTPAS